MSLCFCHGCSQAFLCSDVTLPYQSHAVHGLTPDLVICGLFSYREEQCFEKASSYSRYPNLDTALGTKDRIQLAEYLLSICEYVEDPYSYVNLVKAHACITALSKDRRRTEKYVTGWSLRA